MNKIVAVAVFLQGVNLAMSQGPALKQAEAASVAYHNYRLYDEAPAFGLTKVRNLITNGKKLDAFAEQLAPPLSAVEFNALSVKEKFTYVMIHPEEFNQACYIAPIVVGEEHLIFGRLPGPQGGLQQWSKRQKDFLWDNKSQVTQLLKREIHGCEHVGLNLKTAVAEIDAFALIPDVVSAYGRNEKDLDLLTVLLILMKHGHFQPFERTAIYSKLYGPKSNDSVGVRETEATGQLIVGQAMAFYKQAGIGARG